MTRPKEGKSEKKKDYPSYALRIFLIVEDVQTESFLDPREGIAQKKKKKKKEAVEN